MGRDLVGEPFDILVTLEVLASLLKVGEEGTDDDFGSDEVLVSEEVVLVTDEEDGSDDVEGSEEELGSDAIWVSVVVEGSEDVEGSVPDGRLGSAGSVSNCAAVWLRTGREVVTADFSAGVSSDFSYGPAGEESSEEVISVAAAVSAIESGVPGAMSAPARSSTKARSAGGSAAISSNPPICATRIRVEGFSGAFGTSGNTMLDTVVRAEAPSLTGEEFGFSA